jgi:hypothetical protein
MLLWTALQGRLNASQRVGAQPIASALTSNGVRGRLLPASSASSALGKLRDICGNYQGLARLALPCGGTPAAILYIHLCIRSGDDEDIF